MSSRGATPAEVATTVTILVIVLGIFIAYSDGSPKLSNPPVAAGSGPSSFRFPVVDSGVSYEPPFGLLTLSYSSTAGWQLQFNGQVITPVGRFGVWTTVSNLPQRYVRVVLGDQQTIYAIDGTPQVIALPNDAQGRSQMALDERGNLTITIPQPVVPRMGEFTRAETLADVPINVAWSVFSLRNETSGSVTYKIEGTEGLKPQTLMSGQSITWAIPNAKVVILSFHANEAHARQAQRYTLTGYRLFAPSPDFTHATRYVFRSRVDHEVELIRQ